MIWGESPTTAGNLLFVVIGKTAEVLVIEQATWAKTELNEAGPEVGGESSWEILATASARRD